MLPKYKMEFGIHEWKSDLIGKGELRTRVNIAGLKPLDGGVVEIRFQALIGNQTGGGETPKRFAVQSGLKPVKNWEPGNWILEFNLPSSKFQMVFSMRLTRGVPRD
jgi:hypothetical protein